MERDISQHRRSRCYFGQHVRKESDRWMGVHEVVGDDAYFDLVGGPERMKDGIAYPRCLQTDKEHLKIRLREPAEQLTCRIRVEIYPGHPPEH